MTSDSLVEPTLCKHTKRGGQVLFSVQTLFLQRVELGIRPDPQISPVFGFAHGLNLWRLVWLAGAIVFYRHRRVFGNGGSHDAEDWQYRSFHEMYIGYVQVQG
jgi:hypothetical protein